MRAKAWLCALLCAALLAGCAAPGGSSSVGSSSGDVSHSGSESASQSAPPDQSAPTPLPPAGPNVQVDWSKLEGVEACTISFMTQRMTLTAMDDKFEALLAQAQDCIHKVDPHCDILK